MFPTARKITFSPYRTKVSQVAKLNRPTYGDNWSTLATSIKIRDNYICSQCHVSYAHKPGDLDVHHIISLRRNGRTVRSNLTCLCKHCHKMKHPHMR